MSTHVRSSIQYVSEESYRKAFHILAPNAFNNGYFNHLEIYK